MTLTLLQYCNINENSSKKLQKEAIDWELTPNKRSNGAPSEFQRYIRMRMNEGITDEKELKTCMIKFWKESGCNKMETIYNIIEWFPPAMNQLWEGFSELERTMMIRIYEFFGGLM